MAKASPISFLLAVSLTGVALPTGEATALRRGDCEAIGCQVKEVGKAGGRFACYCPNMFCRICSPNKDVCHRWRIKTDPKRLYPIPGGFKANPKGLTPVRPLGPRSPGLTPVTPIGPRSPVPSVIPRRR